MSHVSHMRPWRNWYTRSTKDAVGQPLGVRFPLVAPNFQASAARVENLSVSAVLCTDGQQAPTVVQCLGVAKRRRTNFAYLNHKHPSRGVFFNRLIFISESYHLVRRFARPANKKRDYKY